MRRAVVGVVMVLATVALALPSQALAGPLYDVRAFWADSNLPPGGKAQFRVQARNLGDAVGSEELTITNQLPEGVTASAIDFGPEADELAEKNCIVSGGGGTVKCILAAGQLAAYARPRGNEKNIFGPSPPGFLPALDIDVDIHPLVTGHGTNTATVSGGSGPGPVAQERQVPFEATPAPFGPVPGAFRLDVFDAAYPAGDPLRQAGAHPFELRVGLEFTTKTVTEKGELKTEVVGRIKTIETTLPRGAIGNPEATPKCDPVQFAEAGATSSSTGCPSDTQVGYLDLNIGASGGELNRVALYNLDPPKGRTADFAFNAAGLVQAHIYGIPDPGREYAIKTVTPNVSNLVGVRDGEVTIWGVPGDPAHDPFRAYPDDSHGVPLGAPWGSAPIRPFLTNPMDCGFENGGARVSIESYGEPGKFTAPEEHPAPLNVEGCDDPRFRFEPEISFQPTDTHAGAPTGLQVNLEVPQRNDEVGDADQLYAQSGNIKAIATPPIKKAIVTFPEGMTVSPSAAQGLASCSPEQIGLGTDSPVRCPDGSQYGTLTLHTPLLPVDAQPKGFIYIAKQDDNPFHEFLALYLVIEDPERGILVKVPGRVNLDSDTGQIKTTFENLPQLPVSNMQVELKGGVRAALVNPSTCGKKTIRAEFFPWHDPSAPRLVESSYEISQKPDGSPCIHHLRERPFRPLLEAGTINPTAGEYSPFVFRLTRTDDDQEFSQLGVDLPPGLVAKLAGVSECSDAGIAQAVSRTGAGEGRLEQINPSCPASSYVGSTDVGVGVGVPLTFVPGKVYLAGPYQGGQLSMVVITPAVVGPYDLGVIAVRSAIHVDSRTADVTVKTDPFPQIFQGIPVRIRDIRVRTDRPEFSLNPTSCAEKRIDAHITGVGGDLKSNADDTAAELSERFQAADCASLGFKPKLTLRLFGGTRRGAHPKLRAVLRMPAGGANIAKVSAALPRSAFLDQGHIRTICTRVQFAQDACPKGSVYGHARAKSPLLDETLSGPIILRSSSNELPDLVMALKGRIDIDAVGRIDSINGGIRNTFDFVPDAPLSWASLTFQGGRKGLLVNSRNLCKRVEMATVKLTAHNGRRVTLRPEVQERCVKAQRRGPARHPR